MAKQKPQNEIRALLLEQGNSPDPKVGSGLKWGIGGSLVGPIITALATGDWQTALIVFAVTFLPVAAQFAGAWIKTDPRLSQVRAILDEMDNTA